MSTSQLDKLKQLGTPSESGYVNQSRGGKVIYMRKLDNKKTSENNHLLSPYHD